MLSGLSSAQHKWELVYDDAPPELAAGAAPAAGPPGAGGRHPAAAVVPHASWSVSPSLSEVQVLDEQDYIVPLHPVYAVPAECAAGIKSYFERKRGF